MTVTITVPTFGRHESTVVVLKLLAHANSVSMRSNLHSVVVSRVSTIEVRVNVSTASEVTVTVGMVSSDEQNSVADGTASSPSTTGEMSSHSVSLD